ncbi:calsyntenin-1-like [Dendronephthya gigantea]|uniref:calsyntenin-1-like n=1 Tax=Dendronephthya gigantea TaxID=151771 RepID=UPI00106947D6|nr:calsyntenin-1-like [Dendronephthya gigantea]
MGIPKISNLFLAFCLAVASGNNLQDRLPSMLRFEHTRFTFQIKENHGIGFTKGIVKAVGCGNKGVSYTIRDNSLFTIHPESGKIALGGRLNYTRNTQHTFVVIANANNGKCKNQKAITWVIFNVLQHNQYRPHFNEEKYFCRIQEETGHIKISPQIRAADMDPGPAGMISQVQVRESDEPFVLELEQATGIVTVKPARGYKFDASRMAAYKFSLQAWDNGAPPRNSPPIKIHCLVVPQNRHSPVFKKKMYVGRVQQGKVSSNIVQVKAKDGDTYKDFGNICEYFIRTSDMPFSINNKGVISLPKPLGNDASDTFVFTVMAKDCGGRISEEATTVNVIVDKDCTPGFMELENKSPELNGCDGMVRITPNIRLNMCGESRQYANFSARVELETAHVLKGCDRETYEASGIFKMCNVNRTMDLLPANYREETWLGRTMRDDFVIGDNVYRFDDKTAIDVPSFLLQYTGNENMTIATWIWMPKKDQQQYILSATDPQRLDRKHFALYTEDDKLVFIHRQESSAGSEDICKSVFVWKPDIFNTRWHHVVVTVNGCQTAKLYVDSKQVALENEKENWPLHGTNMAKRVTVGARWLGREQRYGDYFDGYLGGLSVNFGEQIDEQAINCVYECKEQIKIDSPAPSGFEVTQKSQKVIEINGRGTPENFENILRNLVYVNTRRSPTSGRRPLQIKTTINNQPLPMLNLDVLVSDNEKRALKLSGGGRKVIDLKDLQKYGILIAKKLTITADKCSKYVDSARVEVDPPLSSDEALVNPGPLVDLLNLWKDSLPDGKGLIIRGLATLEEYNMVLREMVFVHLGLEDLRNPSTVVRHKFKITISNLKNRFVSNVLQTELTTDKTTPQFDMQALGRQEQEALPGAVEVDKEQHETHEQRNSFGVMIGVIVAASCVFVFIVLVVAVRMHSSRNVYVDVSQKEDETAPEGESCEQEKMNVTMNPLEKFDTVEDEAGSQGATNQKTLEWDDAYIA